MRRPKLIIEPREQKWWRAEENVRFIVDSALDYAFVALDSRGRIVSLNAAAERLEGYTEKEIIGQHFSCFYPADDKNRQKAEHALEIAAREGRSVDTGWQVRKDGSRFWAKVILTALRDASGTLIGF